MFCHSYVTNKPDSGGYYSRLGKYRKNNLDSFFKSSIFAPANKETTQDSGFADDL